MAKARIRRVPARNVRRLREAKGLSQGALAADAGIYQELVSRIEDGTANFELDTLGRIADALGCDPRDLFEEWSPAPLYASNT
jgi:transcriptional regulator with XRE-family HTH domain